MKIHEKILSTLEKLIAEGQTLSPTLEKEFTVMTDEKLNHAGYVQWNIKALNLLSQVKTGESVHFKKFLDEEDCGLEKSRRHGLSRPAYHSISIEIFYKLAILKALEDDIKSGSFFDEEMLITADAFGDILEQAEHLLEKGYKDAAAVLTGAVLESTLRKLCQKNTLQHSTDATINPLNDLLKDKCYNALVHKQIIAWASLRNDAAHGHFEKYGKKDVQEMLRWTKEFVGERLN